MNKEIQFSIVEPPVISIFILFHNTPLFCTYNLWQKKPIYSTIKAPWEFLMAPNLWPAATAVSLPIFPMPPFYPNPQQQQQQQQVHSIQVFEITTFTSIVVPIATISFLEWTDIN